MSDRSAITAAFGVAPSARRVGVDEWARAVDLGARGRAAAARTGLCALESATSDPVLASLAASTRASLTRQSGRHAGARLDDGRACLLVADAARAGDPWARAAWLDGLVGLAADGLGVGDFAASDRLLRRVETELSDCPGDAHDWLTVGRCRLRHAWVATETALFTADTPGARNGSARALELAADAPSPRHRIKTELIAAAVAAADGRADDAARRAADCEKRCAELGLLPLQWAAATLLAGVGDPTGDAARTAAALTVRLGEFGMPMTPAA